MKIYEIGTGYTPIPAQMGAATEIVVEELTRSFIKNGEDVTIIDIASDDRKDTDLPIIEVKVPRVFAKKDVSLGIMHKLKRVVYSIALAGKLNEILRRTNEKVVLHFHNQYNLFFFLKLMQKKIRMNAVVVYTVHSYIWHGKWDEIKNTINRRYFQEVYCLKRADKVFVLNELTKYNIANHINVDGDRIHLINNGVNTNVYSALKDYERSELKKQYDMMEKKVFVQVGSVCDRKNQLASVELLLPLMKKNNNIVFCYAGGIISPEYQASIERFAELNGVQEQIKYVGELKPGKQLNDFYNLAEAMIFPSKAEGFSLVIIEAMSAGIPVIINHTLQFKLANECLQYSDQDSFAHIVNDQILIPSKRQVLSKKAYESVIGKYSWDAVAKSILLFLGNVLSL